MSHRLIPTKMRRVPCREGPVTPPLETPSIYANLVSVVKIPPLGWSKMNTAIRNLSLLMKRHPLKCGKIAGRMVESLDG